MLNAKLGRTIVKTRIGLWGCGNRTQVLIKDALRRDRIAITRCFDLDRGRAEALAGKLGAKVVDSAKALLGAADVDAFLICLYPGAHAGALLQALPVGRPIYVEKPVATNWEDYEKLRAAALRFDTPVHVGLMHRYCPVFATMTNLVRAGKIGTMIGVTVNWVAWLRKVEDFPGGKDNWHFRPDTGGELIQHFCHTFDWLRQLGGDFTQVSAMCNHLDRKETPIENTWDILLRYRSGALVNFHSSMHNPRNSELGYIEGSEGSLEWEWSAPSVIKFFPNASKKQAGEIVPVANDGAEHERGFELFLESLATGRSQDINLKDGLWASLIPLMARRAAESGATQAFPAIA
ncbi:MAG: Gfo/Idh/MocA family oxidoreductase [Kiritimatiellae bacterium]|nr:Gfo/Idh/MocA family oxidoreductase [Kiritimatiellia bacterium]